MATSVEWHCLALGSPLPSFFVWMGFSNRLLALWILHFWQCHFYLGLHVRVIGQEPWLLRTC